jgi:hypothetical protein
MPPRKFFRRKPKVKKAAKKRRARENNMDTRTEIIKLTGAIVPTQFTPGGTERLSNAVYGYWSPSPQFNAGLVPQSMPLFAAKEFSLYRNLYDQFRVNSITLNIIPRYTMTDAATLVALTDGLTPQMTMGKGVFYTVEDRDGVAPANIEALKRYASVKQHKINKRMSRKYSVKYGNTLFDCQDPAGLDDIQRSLGLKGGITVYGESLPELTNVTKNGVWADVEVVYSVTFVGKAMVGLTANEDGSITVSQGDETSLFPLQQYLSNEDNIHQGSIDASGVLIG